jgi:hypothetical protein
MAPVPAQHQIPRGLAVHRDEQGDRPSRHLALRPRDAKAAW